MLLFTMCHWETDQSKPPGAIRFRAQASVGDPSDRFHRIPVRDVYGICSLYGICDVYGS